MHLNSHPRPAFYSASAKGSTLKNSVHSFDVLVPAQDVLERLALKAGTPQVKRLP